MNGLVKTYPNGFQAVKGIDLDIGDKEFMVLVGPSGCGKTTTLRMIAGLEEVTQGDLYIGERRVNDVVPKDRNIAMVFQNYALYPHMTIFDNMAFGLKLRKVPKDQIKTKVTSVAEVLGIDQLLDRKPKELSGGQRQRVALGRAIVREPEVFLMDEPLSNLDAKLRVQMRAELIRLHKEIDSTFIYVTHDQTEAMTMGTRICVMNNGVIQQVGPPKTIYQNPANVFVAGFIGAPQMNLMEASVTESEGGILLQVMDDLVELPEATQKILREKGYISRKIMLGVRPEDTYIGEKGIKVKVEVVELLGSEIYIYYRLDGTQYIARATSENDVTMGDEIFITYDSDKLHLFDAETENRIL